MAVPTNRPPITIERLQELVEYDPLTGYLYRRKGRARKIPREADGLVVVYDNNTKKEYKFKADKLCYILGFGCYPPEGYKILHKDFDDKNNALNNLSLLKKEDHKPLKEAKRNLIDGGLKIVPHYSDQFTYFVHWMANKIERRKLCNDIISAKVLFSAKQLEYSKILTKYYLT